MEPDSKYKNDKWPPNLKKDEWASKIEHINARKGLHFNVLMQIKKGLQINTNALSASKWRKIATGLQIKEINAEEPPNDKHDLLYGPPNWMPFNARRAFKWEDIMQESASKITRCIKRLQIKIS